MSKWLYILYASVVLIICTGTNADYADLSTRTSSNWNAHSSGTAWGGSGGSTGGFSSGGSHK